MSITLLPDNAERARQSIVLFKAQFGVTLLMLITGWAALIYYQSQSFYDPEATSYEELAHGLVNLVYVVVNILGIVYFLRWFRRAYHNLERAGENIANEENRAIWSWFIPIVSLYRPYTIMKEIWYKTRQFYKSVEGVDHQLVRVWWILFLVHRTIGQVEFRLSLNATDLSDLVLVAQVGLLSNVVELIALTVTIRLIQRVAKMEEDFASAVQIQTIGESIVRPTEAEDEQELY